MARMPDFNAEMAQFVEPPKSTGKPPQNLTLTRCLFPWKNIAEHPIGGEPVLLNMPASPHLYLPVFSDEEKLRACLVRAGVTFDKIKQIMDGDEFLDSVPMDIVVIKDPWFTAEGRVRFLQVQR